MDDTPHWLNILNQQDILQCKSRQTINWEPNCLLSKGDPKEIAKFMAGLQAVSGIYTHFDLSQNKIQIDKGCPKNVYALWLLILVPLQQTSWHNIISYLDVWSTI